ncbi:MAG: metal ABC transporter ATP-binding protein [Candidatus Fermentibacteraceae bacterium]|nr:metal ABC transporter ATP-binding protein [Candidatus Fermentibacteraceae bacterium]
MNPAIEIKDLSVGYRTGNPILNNINLTVMQNDFIAIIGPNGGGKTTLLKVILGLIKPWKGEITIEGKSVTSKTVRAGMGYVPQLIPGKSFPVTVMDVVLMGRLGHSGLFRHFSAADRSAAEENLRRLGIHHLLNANMDSLSGGQKQRVLIARALAGEPDILLLDEPVASVDHETQESFFNLLAQLNDSITIVLVTHDVGAVSAHIKSIACINRTLISHGETLSADAVSRAYGCPFELISHGVPHRVIGGTHQEGSSIKNNFNENGKISD